jgi:hypothetical protein
MDRFDELAREDFMTYIARRAASPEGYVVDECSEDTQRQFAQIRRDTWNEAIEAAARRSDDCLGQYPASGIAGEIRALKVEQIK